MVQINYDMLCDELNHETGETCDGPLKLEWIPTNSVTKWGRKTECSVCHTRHYEHVEVAEKNEIVYTQCEKCKVHVSSMEEFEGDKMCHFCAEDRRKIALL